MEVYFNFISLSTKHWNQYSDANIDVVVNNER